MQWNEVNRALAVAAGGSSSGTAGAGVGASPPGETGIFFTRARSLAYYTLAAYQPDCRHWREVREKEEERRRRRKINFFAAAAAFPES